MSEEIMPSGYSEEERYFFEKDQASLEKKRHALDTDRKAKMTDEARTDHWMKCPKCGKNMIEVDMDGVMVDRCESCQGLYFDAGELELLLMSRQSSGVMTSLRSLFG
jgi:acetyl-CoA carboxylase beta subunit